MTTALYLSLTLSCLAATGGPAITVDGHRGAFYRGERILLTYRCTNTGSQPVRRGRLTVTLGDTLRAGAELGDLAPGDHRVRALRFDSALLKLGSYKLEATLSGTAGPPARLVETVRIAMKPNPDRLLVWLWGNGGGAWYVDHGFTSWYGMSWRHAAGKIPGDLRHRLDEGLVRGCAVGISPNGGLRDLADATFKDPDAWYVGLRRPSKLRIPNPFHPQVARRQDQANRALMELVRDYPQIKTAFFNTEIVDVLRTNRNVAGMRLMREMLGTSDMDTGTPKFIAPGVIADDDRRYVLRKYFYQHGNGLVLANRRTAAMIHGYRQDILTITDPFREVALLDLFPGIDVIETWTYTNPDPKLMLYVETLRAACRPTGQIPLNTVTMLNYPGELTPGPEWTLMGPGRVKVTSWINLSRAPKIVGYYYSSECPPNKYDDARVPYRTSMAIKELADKIYQPYGPMITRLENVPRRIAVLSSEAARVYGKSPNLLGGYANMQIYHYYTVLAMAHLQADVVFDETIERYGLDDYDMLVLPKCDVLPQGVFDRIRAFAARGGRLIADQYLGADLPGVVRFDFDFTYRKKVTAKAIAENKIYARWNDQLRPESAALQTVRGVTARDDQRIMESYAQRLRHRLAGKVEPAVDCDSPTVLLNLLQAGRGAKYLVLINDKRTYDDRVGQFKAVLGKLLPQTAKIRVNCWTYPQLHAYDILQHRAVPVRRVISNQADGSGKQVAGVRPVMDLVRDPAAAGGNDREFDFTVALSELGGTIIAMYPTALARLTIHVAGTMPRGLAHPVSIDITDDQGSPVPGLQPLRLLVTDPAGNSSDPTGYYCAQDGRLTIGLTPALNDRPGRWTITAVDLTAGLSGTRTFSVTD